MLSMPVEEGVSFRAPSRVPRLVSLRFRLAGETDGETIRGAAGDRGIVTVRNSCLIKRAFRRGVDILSRDAAITNKCQKRGEGGRGKEQMGAENELGVIGRIDANGNYIFGINHARTDAIRRRIFLLNLFKPSSRFALQLTERGHFYSFFSNRRFFLFLCCFFSFLSLSFPLSLFFERSYPFGERFNRSFSYIRGKQRRSLQV